MDKTVGKSGGWSRRGFAAGVAAGAAGTWALTSLPRRCFQDPDRPPWISEFFLDNFWFNSVDLYHQPVNAPLTSSINSDIAIIGGGFTGLASAYHLRQEFPNKRIVLLESAYCGYGASGRNGGQAIPMHPLGFSIFKEKGAEAAKKFYDLNSQGLSLIKELVGKHGISCDLEESGIMMLAMSEQDLAGMEETDQAARAMGINSRVLDRKEIQREIRSDRYHGALNLPYGAIINPAKLARGMKKAVESMGVEVFERTRVISVDPGPTVRINTEEGEVSAPVLVLAANGYSAKLGFFKNRFLPLCDYVIATEPLSPERLNSIGWAGRQLLWDSRVEFDYFRLTTDNRIVFGGELAPYFYGGKLSSGNYKPSLKMLEQGLFTTFPQLSGLKITHRWGGTMAFTLDEAPFMGVTGPHKNVFYSMGYSGEGVVLSQLGGKIISQLCAGHDTDLTRLPFVNRRVLPVPPEPARYVSVRLYKKLLNWF
jgi:glycine/D-amino acid oxidase-like deaminating enzyme